MRKRISVFGLIAMCMTLVFALAACGGNDTPPGPPADRILQNITLNTDNVKKSFTVGEAFSHEGLVVTAHYDSEPLTETVPEKDYTVSAPDLNSAGTKPVVVTYQRKTATYTITVAEQGTTPPDPPEVPHVLLGITLNTEGVRKSFTVGETFSYEGLAVTAEYDTDPVSVPVDLKDVRVVAPDLSSAGEGKRVIVIYGGVTAEYTVDVTEADPVRTLRSIFVDPSDAERMFEVGSEFTYEGIKVYGNYNIPPLTEEITSGYTVNTDGIDTSVEGSQTVIVTYRGFTAGYEITVNPLMPERIEVDDEGAEHQFFVNDVFSADGIVVTAYYKSGDPVVVEAGSYTVTAPDMTETGDKEVVVSYLGCSDSYQINVKEPEIVSLSVNTEKATVKFAVGSDFSSEGIVVTANYDNKKSRILTTSDYTVTAPDMNTENEQATVTVKLNGAEISTTYTVAVLEDKLVSITLDTDKVTLTFGVNGTFNHDGLVVTAHYTVSPDKVLQESEFEVEEPDLSQAGSVDVKVTHETVSATYSITVEARNVQSIEAVTDEVKMTFKEGDAFTYAGLKIKVTYEDEDEPVTLDSGFEVAGPTDEEMRTAGQKTVTVRYLGAECTYTVTVEAEARNAYSKGTKKFPATMAEVANGGNLQGTFIGGISSGTTITFKVDSSFEGSVLVSISAAGQVTGDAFTLTVNGKEIASVAVNTGNWTNWTEIPVGFADLHQGENVFVFTATSNANNNVNVDGFVLSSDAKMTAVYDGEYTKYGISYADVTGCETVNDVTVEGSRYVKATDAFGSVTYTVNVTKEDTVEIRAAVAGGRTEQDGVPTEAQTEAFSVSVNGRLVGTFDVGPTAWNEFIEISLGYLDVNAGELTITVQSVGGNFSFAYISLAHANVYTGEEELTVGAKSLKVTGSGNLQGDQNTADGSRLGDIHPGTVLTYSVQATAEGTFDLVVCFVGGLNSAWQNPVPEAVEIVVNGVTVGKYDTIDFGNGQWTNYRPIAMGQIHLTEGSNTIEIRFSCDANFNYFKLTPVQDEAEEPDVDGSDESADVTSPEEVALPDEK